MVPSRREPAKPDSDHVSSRSEPEPISEDDLAQWAARVRSERNATLEQLATVRAALPESVQPLIDQALTSRDSTDAVISAAGPVPAAPAMPR